MRAVEEASYPTPDPPDRPAAGGPISTEMVERHTGLEVARMMLHGDLPQVPIAYLMGMRPVAVDEGQMEYVMPASDWFCRQTRDVGEAAIANFLDVVGTSAALTLLDKGQLVVGLETQAKFLRSVPADGRELTGRGRFDKGAGDVRFIEAEVLDADGSTIATQTLVLGVREGRDRRPVEPERILATLLFTDIVGSTERAQRMGDAAWRSLLGEHHALVRRELVAHRGREINTIGDGFLARFDSPASAVRCAKAIRDGVGQLDLEVRAGVHTGECEVHGTDLAGIALHVGSRIGALAGAGEILVSQTVRDLAAGSGLRFTSRGSHRLKGVDGDWTLFAVNGS